MGRMKITSLWFLCGVLLLFFWASSVRAQTAQEIAKKAFGSTVVLVMGDANGHPLSLGSGFFVCDGGIASNLHVVEGAARGYAKLVGEKTKHEIGGITAVDPERDLVVIKISAGRLQVLPLGNSDCRSGIISSIREVGTDKLLQITASGSSGRPVLNNKGEVVRVSVATFS